jgi:hypothetical protein
MNLDTVSLPLVVLLCGLTVFGLVLLARWCEALSWRRSLVAFKLNPPGSLSADNVTAWLNHINSVTHPTRFALLPLPPVCLEVISTVHGIDFYMIVTKRAVPRLLSGVRAAMPGARVTEAPEYLTRRPRWQVAAELTMPVTPGHWPPSGPNSPALPCSPRCNQWSVMTPRFACSGYSPAPVLRDRYQQQVPVGIAPRYGLGRTRCRAMRKPSRQRARNSATRCSLALCA